MGWRGTVDCYIRNQNSVT